MMTIKLHQFLQQVLPLPDDFDIQGIGTRPMKTNRNLVIEVCRSAAIYILCPIY